MKLARRGRAVIVLVALLSGCPDDSSSRRITHERIATVPWKTVESDATSADRFGTRRDIGSSLPARTDRKSVSWELPPGWNVKPDAGGMRVGSFALASSPEADASITLLPTVDQGIPANVNRWRKQMNLGELVPETSQSHLIGSRWHDNLGRDRMPAHIVRRGAAEGREGGGELEGDDILEADATAAAGEMQRARAAIRQ